MTYARTLLIPNVPDMDTWFRELDDLAELLSDGCPWEICRRSDGRFEVGIADEDMNYGLGRGDTLLEAMRACIDDYIARGWPIPFVRWIDMPAEFRRARKGATDGKR